MKTVAIIPARANSKGLPHKNTRDFCGQPLWRWAYQVGLATCDLTFVTTDDPKISLDTGDAYDQGRMIVRPSSLAQDDTPMLPVIKHVLKEIEPYKPDVVVLLQPTSPLRTCEDVEAALKVLEEDKEGNVDSVVSVVPIPAHYSPDYAMRQTGAWLKPFRPKVKRRQNVRPAYSRDGTVYATRVRCIRNHSLYGTHCHPLFIDPRRSANIDDEEDWKRAETLMLERQLARA